MTPHQLLIEARALIADPKHWTQETLARDVHGNELSNPASGRAVCWCAHGAIDKVSLDRAPYGVIMTAKVRLERFAHERDYASLADMNDRGDHALVLRAFDTAIEETRP